MVKAMVPYSADDVGPIAPGLRAILAPGTQETGGTGMIAGTSATTNAATNATTNAVVGRKAVAGPAVLIMCLVSLMWSTAEAASPVDIDGAAVAWSRLEFRAASRPNDLSVEVKLSDVSPEQVAALLQSSPGDGPAPTPDATVLQMTSTIDVFVTGRAYQTDIWFYSAEASPLQRRRDKTGGDANRKIFQYLADGVRRLRLEPNGSAEAKLAPENWTRIKENFYPYGAARTGCSALSDPNLLFFIASAGTVTGRAEPLALCVFNKQSIHRVQLSADAGGTLEADYLEIKGTAQNQVRRKTAVRKVRVQAFPPEVDGVSPEPFEFFELGGEIEIDLDAENGLPLRIAGEIGGLGRVDFLLSEVTWRP
jgi:hypothetical protein